MAKKKRTAKRSTKAGKRRPTTKRKSRSKIVSAKGEAGGVGTASGVGASTAAGTGNAAGAGGATAVGAFDLTPQHIARPRPNLGAAVQSTIGGAEPPFPLRAGAHMIEPPSADLNLSTTAPEVRFHGDSSLRADATVIPAPTKAVIVDRLSKQPVVIRDTARAYAHALKREAESLRSHRPNDRSERELAKYDDLVSFLEKMAAGLTDLAAALDEAIKEATEGSVDPARLTAAAQITHNLQQAVMQWLENNAGSRLSGILDVAMFTGSVLLLHSFGADSATAIGALGYIVRNIGRRKDPPKKKPDPPKKKRR